MPADYFRRAFVERRAGFLDFAVLLVLVDRFAVFRVVLRTAISMAPAGRGLL
jgi:hypothetical protein